MISADKIVFIHALSDYHFHIETEFINYLDILTPNNISQTITLNTSKIYKETSLFFGRWELLKLNF